MTPPVREASPEQNRAVPAQRLPVSSDRLPAFLRRGFHPNFPFAPARWPVFYGWTVFATATLGIVASIPGQTMGVSAFTDALIDATGLSRLQFSNAYLVGTLASGMLLPAGGTAIDRLGTRAAAVASCLALGLVLWALSVADRLAIALAELLGLPAGWVAFGTLAIAFLCLRFSGQGMLTLTSRTALGKWFDRRRGFVSGLSGVFVSFGFAGAPLAFSWAIDLAGWRGAWRGLGLLVGLGMGAIAWLLLRDNPEECGLRMDGDGEKGGQDGGVRTQGDREIRSEIQPETQSEIQPKTQSETHSEIDSKIRPEAYLEVTSKTDREISPEIPPKIQPEIPPEIQPEIPPEPQPDSDRQGREPIAPDRRPQFVAPRRDYTRPEALRTLAFWATTLVLASQALSVTGVTFHIVDLGAEAGLARQAAVSIFLPIAIVATTTGYLVGLVADRAPLHLIFAGMALFQGMGLASVAHLDASLGWALTIAGLGVSGGCFGTLATATLPRFFGRSHLGAISGAQMTSMVVASALGPSVLAAVQQQFGSYRFGLYGFGLLTLPLAALVLRVRNPQESA